MLGYIGYSLVLRVFQSDPPTAAETAVVVFASVLPDLIDKPLAWQFELFASGYGISHSILIAVPVCTAALLVASRRGVGRRGVAFGFGYLLHLFGDVFPRFLSDGSLPLHRVLWPLRREGSGYEKGFRGEFRENMTEYAAWLLRQIDSGEPDPYLLGLLGMTAFGLLLWIVDGMPVGREAYRALARPGRNSDR